MAEFIVITQHGCLCVGGLVGVWVHLLGCVLVSLRGWALMPCAFSCWAFIRKDLCEARAKCQSSKNQIIFLHLVRCTPHRWGFRSGWHLVRIQVRLTFGEMFPNRHLGAKCDTTSGQVDIWSDLWVRLTSAQAYPSGRDILWPSVILPWVRFTFSQTYPQT